MSDDRELTSRQAVWRKYARTFRSGNPRICVPGQMEIRERGWTVHTGSDGKVIYDTREQAEAAAKALRKLGWPPLVAYPCDRSKHGHHHLTSKLDRADGNH